MDKKQKAFEALKKDMDELTNRFNEEYKKKHSIDIKVEPQYLNKNGLIYLKFKFPEEK